MRKKLLARDRVRLLRRSEVQESILALVRGHPEYSSIKISEKLPKGKDGKTIVGNHGVWRVLERLGLSTYAKRLEFARGKRHIPLKEKLSASDRLHMIRKAEAGGKVADICRQYGISRTIFYRLLARYKNALLEGKGEKVGDLQLRRALRDKPPIPEQPWRLTPPEIVNKLLEIIAKSPELSAHKFVEALPTVDGRPILSNKGVQNVLRRLNLSTYEQRLGYSRLTEKAWKPRWALAKIPEIPLYIWRMLYAPFATIPKLGWLFTRGQLLLLLTLLLGFYFYQILAAIVTSPTGTVVGTFFASISLTFGLFFLIYSLKYYFSTLLVLRLAQSGEAGQPATRNQKPETGGKSKSIGNILRAIPIVGRVEKFLGSSRPFDFAQGSNNNQSRVNPLLVNLDRVKLGSGGRPFVSIHVAVYNEKRVVERLIRACTAQEWYQESSKLKEANYEVVIVDDSTDETTEIAKQTLIDNGWKLNPTNVILGSPSMSLRVNSATPESDSGQARMTDQDQEIFVFTKPNAPTVKLIHRASRSGFKGGALQKALLATDIRAQYVVVFDADFVPYPDTIEQFVKTFQVLGQSPSSQFSVDSSQTGQEGAAATVNPKPLTDNRIAAVQGYQWHVLNKSQTWVTRGVRTEYAGSYVIERSGEEIYGGLKQIAGSVYAIRADILRQFGWGTSITEDFELTLRLYEAGYKVAFTPYIQAPAEAVSTIKRLVRQRMRWAEGASFNVKKMFRRILTSGNLTPAEKAEFVYLSPYYLQAFFFVVGTFSWFLAEAVLGSRLPFWTAAFGWSLVFTNLLALPLMNIVGMFLEESDERDYVGVLSFIALSYIVVPFQAYAAIKGFLEKEEGPWFRTPKTGLVTDVFGRSGFGKFFGGLLGSKPAAAPISADIGGLVPSVGGMAFKMLRADNFRIGPRRQVRWIGKVLLVLLLTMTITVHAFSRGVPEVYATNPSGTFNLDSVDSTLLSGTNWKLLDNTNGTDATTTIISLNGQTGPTGRSQYFPGTNRNPPTVESSACGDGVADGNGWIFETPFQSGGQIANGTWTFYVNETDDRKQMAGTLEVCVYKITISGASISSSTLLFSQTDTTDVWDLATNNFSFTSSQGQHNIGADEYLYVEYFLNTTATGGGPGTVTSTFGVGPSNNNARITTPSVTIPENVVFLLAAVPFIPMIVLWMRKRRALQLTSDPTSSLDKLGTSRVGN